MDDEPKARQYFVESFEDDFPIYTAANAAEAVELLSPALALQLLLQAGLPLVERPYAQWADELGGDEDGVTERIGQWLAEGRLKRFGVVVRHHELGFSANAMTVFDVPDHLVDACGEALAQQPGVTLAYRRERAGPWPYNLYCMVHGTDRTLVQGVIDRVVAAAGLAGHRRTVLFSTRRFKQTGAHRFRALPLPTQEVSHALDG